MSYKFIQSFGLGEAIAETRAEVLGGKGAGLVWMNTLGVRIPPGFVLPTSMCRRYQHEPEATMDEIKELLPQLMGKLTSHFGYRPLVSVRSGARVSMPGMMDTILNVGLDGTTYDEWCARIGNDCTADSDRRLIEMYINVVKGVPREKFFARSADLGDDTLDAYRLLTGENFPDKDGQLLGAVEAVFKSWNNPRAQLYRKLNNIPDDWGTACVVQAMVFGNMDDRSCTGVLFTRNPDTGEDQLTGEFLPNAQGEDVVAGIRTPLDLSEMQQWDAVAAAELAVTAEQLESTRTDVQDIEFTVQQGRLYILQTRTAKRSANAALKIALDMLDVGMIDPATAFRRVSKRQYALAQQPQLDPAFKTAHAWQGLPACTGVVSGKVVHTAEAAVEAKGPVILVTAETTPNDLAGMHAAVGILTMTGGSTSHAAVVARGMNRPCVVGLGKTVAEFPAGTMISICGGTGRIWKGVVPTVGGEDNPLVQRLNQLMVNHDYTKVMVDSTKPLKVAAKTAVLDGMMLVLKTVSAAVLMVKDLLTQYQELVIDLTPPTAEPVRNFLRLVYDESVGAPWRMAGAVKALAEGIPSHDHHRVIIIANHAIPSTEFKWIKPVNELPELVMAEAGAELLLGLEPTPAVLKVMDWQTQAGVKIIMAGKSGIKSVPQLVDTLLGE